MRHLSPSLLSLSLALTACEPPAPAGDAPTPDVAEQAVSLPTVWVVVHPSDSAAPGLYRVDLAQGGAVLSSLPLPAGLESPHSIALDETRDELIVAGFDAVGPKTVAVRARDGVPTNRALLQGYEVAVDPSGALWSAGVEGVALDAANGATSRFVADTPMGLTAMALIDGELTTLVNGARDWMLSWGDDAVPTRLRVLPEEFQGTYAIAQFDDLLLVAANETIHALRGDEIVASVTLPVGPWITGMTIAGR